MAGLWYNFSVIDLAGAGFGESSEGLLPPALIFTNLLSKSNQNGAPKVIANAVMRKPNRLLGLFAVSLIIYLTLK